MNTIFSYGALARIAALISIGFGALAYSHLGLAAIDAKPWLSPVMAGAVSMAVATVVFYVTFGILSMHWLGRKYWFFSTGWGAVWLGAFILLGEDWLTSLCVVFTILTVLIISIALPRGGLTVPSDEMKTRRHG